MSQEWWTEQHGYKGQVFSKEISDLALNSAFIKCQVCNKEIVWFDQCWYDVNIDFDLNIYVPEEKHECTDSVRFSSKFSDPPFVKTKDGKTVAVNYWDIFPNKETRQKAQRFVHFKHSSGSKICDWVEIDSSGNCNKEVKVSQSQAMGLFQAVYKWYSEGTGTYELSFCDTGNDTCKSKGFHGEFDINEHEHPCPFAVASDRKVRKKCDCYLTKVSGNSLEKLVAIDKIHKHENPMNHVGFMGWVAGMLSFLERKV